MYRQLKRVHLLGASRNLQSCDIFSALHGAISCRASGMDVDLDCQVKGMRFASRQRQSFFLSLIHIKTKVYIYELKHL